MQYKYCFLCSRDKHSYKYWLQFQ